MWEAGWAKWVRGTKESTPEIIVALYTKQFGCKFKKVKQVNKKKKDQVGTKPAS